MGVLEVSINQSPNVSWLHSGFPPELYRGTLTLQSAAVGLRLFERSWQPFVHDLNDALQWMTSSLRMASGCIRDEPSPPIAW